MPGLYTILEDEAFDERASPVLGTRAPFSSPEAVHVTIGYRARYSSTNDGIMSHFPAIRDAYRSMIGVNVLDRLWDDIEHADFKIICGSTYFKVHSAIMLAHSGLIAEELRENKAQGLSTDSYRVKPRLQQSRTVGTSDCFHVDEIEELIYFAYHLEFSPKILGKEYFARMMFIAHMYHVAIHFKANEMMQAMTLKFEMMLEYLSSKTQLQVAYFLQEMTPVLKWIFFQPFHGVEGYVELQDVIIRYLIDHYNAVKDLVEFEYMLFDIPEMIPRIPNAASIIQ